MQTNRTCVPFSFIYYSSITTCGFWFCKPEPGAVLRWSAGLVKVLINSCEVENADNRMETLLELQLRGALRYRLRGLKPSDSVGP